MNHIFRTLLLSSMSLAAIVLSGPVAAQSLDGVKLVDDGKLTYGVAASFAPFELCARTEN